MQLFNSTVVAWRWPETRRNWKNVLCSHRILFPKKVAEGGRIWPTGCSLRIPVNNNAFLLSLFFPLSGLRDTSCQGPAFLSSNCSALGQAYSKWEKCAWEWTRWNPLIILITTVTVETASVYCTLYVPYRLVSAFRSLCYLTRQTFFRNRYHSNLQMRHLRLSTSYS